MGGNKCAGKGREEVAGGGHEEGGEGGIRLYGGWFAFSLDYE